MIRIFVLDFQAPTQGLDIQARFVGILPLFGIVIAKISDILKTTPSTTNYSSHCVVKLLQILYPLAVHMYVSENLHPVFFYRLNGSAL
jgi:hypothetical protein